MRRPTQRGSPQFMLPAILILLAGGPAFAENIDPDNDGSQYAWAENVGWLNAEPNGNGGDGVQVGDFELTGWMWAENMGWVSLSCQNTSSCGTVSYGVRNSCVGVLSGFAWTENVGWINFDPAFSGVTIDTVTGVFSGYAWGENIGWISFNCANTATCGTVDYKVKTGWAPSTVAPAGSPILTVEPLLLSWSELADGYDIVRGDLTTLRSSGGDFGLATEECLANDHPDTSLPYSVAPNPGEGFWFLVRGTNCGGNGTYDSPGAMQVGLRDAEIVGSGNDCL